MHAELIILASTSPRRAELLTAWGIPFEVVPPQVEEIRAAGEAPAAFAARLAQEKAESVAQQHPERIVLAADTIVVLDDEIFGKPIDTDDALRMLQRLAGRTHQVITAVAAYALHIRDNRRGGRDPAGEWVRGARAAGAGERGLPLSAFSPAGSLPPLRSPRVTTEVAHAHVTMAAQAEADLRAYVATGEPLDKAGAYAVQGLGGRLVTHIDGEYSTVVGLPRSVTLRLLASALIR